jgi:hypothetical protein
MVGMAFQVLALEAAASKESYCSNPKPRYTTQNCWSAAEAHVGHPGRTVAMNYRHVFVVGAFALYLWPQHLVADSSPTPTSGDPTTQPSVDAQTNASTVPPVTAGDVDERRQKKLAPIEDELTKVQHLFDQLPDDAKDGAGSVATHLADLKAEKAKILAIPDSALAADILSERVEAAAEAEREKKEAEQAQQLAAQQVQEQQKQPQPLTPRQPPLEVGFDTLQQQDAEKAKQSRQWAQIQQLATTPEWKRHFESMIEVNATMKVLIRLTQGPNGIARDVLGGLTRKLNGLENTIYVE